MDGAKAEPTSPRRAQELDGGLRDLSSADRWELPKAVNSAKGLETMPEKHEDLLYFTTVFPEKYEDLLILLEGLEALMIMS